MRKHGHGIIKVVAGAARMHASKFAVAAAGVLASLAIKAVFAGAHARPVGTLGDEVNVCVFHLEDECMHTYTYTACTSQR